MENTSTADGISELPDDEILHCILSRIQPQREAAQTITLSRRWRSLWRSYPVVAYFSSDGDRLDRESLQKFCEATIARFSRDSSLRMETLELHLIADEFELCCPVYKQLLALSSERKAEEIDVWSFTTRIDKSLSLPFQLLSNSSTKIITIRGVQFSYDNDLALSLNSLRFLHLCCVVFFEDDRLLGDVIASSPLLETLEIDFICIIRELKVSIHQTNLKIVRKNTNLKIVRKNTNLKTLRIGNCFFRKIEIGAPGLQTLRLKDVRSLSKFELSAPQLNLLEITDCISCCFDTVISELQYLKTLTLDNAKLGKKLKLSNPKLEEFTLRGPRGLEEIEIDACPSLVKFLLSCDADHSFDEIKKCQIRNDFSLEIHTPDDEKDIKMETRGVDRATKKEVEDLVEFLSASKIMLTEVTTVSFMLTWD